MMRQDCILSEGAPEIVKLPNTIPDIANLEIINHMRWSPGRRWNVLESGSVDRGISGAEDGERNGEISS